MAKPLAKKKLKTNAQKRRLLASVPRELFIDALDNGEPVVLTAAGTGGEDGPQVPSFETVVYNGGKIRPQGFSYPVVCELRGLAVMSGPRPALYIHNQTKPVGHTTEVKVERSIKAKGLLSVDCEESRMIAASDKNGFPWKTSMGVLMEDLRFFDSQETFQANGRTWRGPCFYLAKGQLYEISFVPVAGDNTSSAKITASLGGLNKESDAMDWEQWLAANGFGDVELTVDQERFLRAQFGASQNPQNVTLQNGNGQNLNAGGGNGHGGGNGGGGTQVLNAAQAADEAVLAIRNRTAAELMRQSDLQSLCASYGNPTVRINDANVIVSEGGREVSLLAHAVQHNWDRNATELAALRASRIEAPAIHIHAGGNMNEQVLEAAIRLTLGGANSEESLVAEYGERTMTAAANYRNLSLRDTARIACEMEGKPIPRVWGDGRKTLEAAFTTMSLPNVFENVMNKTLLVMYQAYERFAHKLCSISRCTDFKQVSRVRLLGSGAWSKVGADGQLQHGVVSDTKFTNQIDTFGQYLCLTRQDWINDDLGALEALSKYMAIMGMQVVDDEFFRLLLSNPGNFFHADNANLGSGAFSIDNLSALKVLFKKQKAGPGTQAKNKRPINVNPVKLVVPVELEDKALSLLGSPNMIQGNQKTDATVLSLEGNKNPHYSKYELIAPPQLSDSYFSGYSAVKYYLFADPNLLAAFDLMYLNGIQTPTIERVNAAPGQLGWGWQGYIDFGLNDQDPKGAACSSGA